jgi:hypothetical protein
MKTTLPESINSEAEAKRFLAQLAKNGELYHPDDPAADVITIGNNRLFTDEEAPKVDALMKQVFEHLPDPYGYGISLDIKFDEHGIAEPFEISGEFHEAHGIKGFTPAWFSGEDAQEWYLACWEDVNDALNDPYRDQI